MSYKCEFGTDFRILKRVSGSQRECSLMVLILDGNKKIGAHVWSPLVI